MRWLYVLLLGAFSTNVFSLIFPLQPGKDGAYDVEYNTLHSYAAVWRTNGHAIVNIASHNGVAIAPRWVLTAWHLATQMDESWYVSDDAERYYFQEKVNLDNDLALVRVDKPFPFYSRLQKFPGGADDILTVYGQSAAPSEPILDADGLHIGWKFGPATNHPALRWGQGRRLLRPNGTIEWDFTHNDPLIGNSGLNCAVVNTNDSGGGIFVKDALVGIIRGFVSQGFRLSRDEPVTAACDVTVPGHVFNPSTVFRCTTSLLRPITRTYGTPVYPALSKIFARISPPQQMHAGTASLTNSGVVWEPTLSCAGCSTFLDSSVAPIDSSNLTGAAPQGVYKSAAYIAAQPSGSIVIQAKELIRYEKYRVRLHFASIVPAESAGACLQLVDVQGQSVLFDPHTGVRKATLLTFDDISPDETSEIRITITPRNPGGFAAISGVEISLNPLAPSVPGEVKVDLSTIYPISPGGNPVFGNGKFVLHRLFSDDNGLSWQRSNDSPWQPGQTIVFANGRFVATGYMPEGQAVATSEDGRTWLPQPLGREVEFKSIAWGAGHFIGVGNAGTNGFIAISDNGRNWEFLADYPNIYLESVSYGNGRFVARDTLLLNVVSSTDGRNWIVLAPNVPPPEAECLTKCPSWWSFSDLLFDGEKFVTSAIGSVAIPRVELFLYQGSILTSRDGATWSQLPGTIAPSWPFGLRWANQQFIYLPNRTFSSDLEQWQTFEMPLNDRERANSAAWRTPFNVAYGNSTYLLIGSLAEENTNPTFSRATSAQWARGSNLHALQRIDYLPPVSSRARVAINGKTLVAVNPYPGFPVPLFVSTNSGAAFCAVDLPPDAAGLRGIKFAQEQFVAVGEKGKILHSPDGLTWSRSSTDHSGDLYDVAYGDRLWVAVGTNGLIVTSPDALTFSAPFSRASVPLYGVAYGAAGFVAVGAAGDAVSSINGQNWVPSRAGAVDLVSIAYGNGLYIAVGTNGTAQISSNGVIWSESRPTSASLRDIAYGDGQFIALEPSNPPNPSVAYFSLDGISWASARLPVGSDSLGSSGDSIWVTSAVGRVVSMVINQRTIGILRLRTPNLRLQPALESDGAISIAFDAPSSGLYSVLSTPSLSSSVWETNAVLKRDLSDEITWKLPSQTETGRFFRVRLD